MRKALEELLPDSRRTTVGARQDFYDKFQREASDHDRDFTEKYDLDLDTTLIFVGIFSCIHLGRGLHTFSWGIGRSVLRRHVRFHRLSSAQSPTGLRPIELRSPPGYSQQHQLLAWWACHNWFRCHPSSMAWSWFRRYPCPSHALREFGRYPSGRVRRDDGQTVAQTLFTDGDAWICH